MALTQVQGGMLAGSSNTTTTIQSNGTTAITIDASQNVGIGTSTVGTFYGKTVEISNANDCALKFTNAQTGYTSSDGTYIGLLNSAATDLYINNREAGNMLFQTSNTERMRIDSAGTVTINATSLGGSQARLNIQQDCSGSYYAFAINNTAAGTTSYVIQDFYRNSSRTGSITQTGGTSYNTTSDYRLKKDVNPIVGALNKIALLKPVTFKWKENDEIGEGFIAHELQEICPLAVHGEKDAIDKNGNIDPQGVDTSNLVGLLTAAIQELNAKVDAQAAEITALKAAK